LIAGEDVAVSNLTQQQKFFSSHLQPWILLMCEDLQAHPKAHFFSALGELTKAFMSVETQGFDMLDPA
jgi:TorA maturation chaperone TorD